MDDTDAPNPDVAWGIAIHAYELWEAAGKPADRDLEFWLLAERELRFPPTDGR